MDKQNPVFSYHVPEDYRVRFIYFKQFKKLILNVILGTNGFLKSMARTEELRL